MPGPAEVSCLGLLLSGGSLVLGLAEVSDSGLFPYTCSCEVCFLRPVLSLSQACFHRFPWFGPASREVPGLGPVLQRSLVQVYSLEGLRLMPGPTEVSGYGLFPQWTCCTSLSCSCFSGVCCLRPALLEFTGSGLFL